MAARLAAVVGELGTQQREAWCFHEAPSDDPELDQFMVTITSENPYLFDSIHETLIIICCITGGILQRAGDAPGGAEEAPARGHGFPSEGGSAAQ